MDATQWDTLSDLEINTSVALTLGGEVCSWPNPPRLGVTFDGVYAVDVDYCNNPADAWPIIVDNKISITNELGEWVASNSFYVDENGIANSEHWEMHKNPLRAAMIVFLMMQDAKP